MPELPEVETVVRGLRGPLVGRTFTKVQVLWPRTVKTSIPELEQNLPGQRIEAITRRAKYLQFQLSSGATLFIHLKMSGDLLVEPVTDPIHPHVRAIFELDNHHQLRFKDMRKFGRVYLVNDPNQVIGKLGQAAVTVRAVVKVEFLCQQQDEAGGRTAGGRGLHHPG